MSNSPNTWQVRQHRGFTAVRFTGDNHLEVLRVCPTAVTVTSAYADGRTTTDLHIMKSGELIKAVRADQWVVQECDADGPFGWPQVLNAEGMLPFESLDPTRPLVIPFHKSDATFLEPLQQFAGATTILTRASPTVRA